MSFELPVSIPTVVFLPAIVVTFVLTYFVGAWAFLFLAAVALAYCARYWSRAHEPRTQLAVDVAHTIGPMAGLGLVMGFGPSGIWFPVLFLMPVMVFSSAASIYAQWLRRSSVDTTPFEHGPGGAVR